MHFDKIKKKTLKAVILTLTPRSIQMKTTAKKTSMDPKGTK